MSAFTDMQFVEVSSGKLPELHNFDVANVIVGKLKNIRSNMGPNKSHMYDLELEDGSVRAIWGSYQLDQALTTEAIGSIFRITFTGTVDIEGGKTVRTYTIERAAA